MLLWSAITAALLLWAPQVFGQSTCPILGCATGQCTTLTVDLTQNWASKRNDTQWLGWGRPRTRGGFGRAGPWGRKLLRSGFGWGWGWAASVNVWSCKACDSAANYKAISGPYNTTSCICQDGFGRKNIGSTACEPCGEGSVPLGPLSGVVLRSNRTTWPPTLYYTLGNSSATNYPWKRGNHGYSFQQCVKCPEGSSTANEISCVAGASNSSSSSLPTATSKDKLIVLIPVAMHAGTMPEVMVSSETDPQLAASISAALNAEAATSASDAAAAAAVATDTSTVATDAAAEDSTGQGQGDATAAAAVQPAFVDATAAAVAATAAAGDSTGQGQGDAAAAAAAVQPASVDATAAAVAATEAAAAADGNTIAAEDQAVPPGGP